MPQLDLVPIWAAILALAVLLYVLLDGFDLGVGILFHLRRDETERDLMINSVAPIWDFNETWLVLGSGGLFAVFPLAFAIIMPALYFPILVMLLGLLFRGVAFEFRAVIRAKKGLWNDCFAFGSLIATIAQGVVLGNYIQGFTIVGRAFAGSSMDWLRPFPLATGAGLVVGYALLGATWLVMKTEGELQVWARRMAHYALIGTVAFILLVSIWTALSQAHIAQRWFSWPNVALLAPVPILTAGVVITIFTSLKRNAEILPFVGAIALFVLSFVGLIISLWPYVVVPSVTLWDAATAPLSQAFLLIGTLFMLPVLLLYVFWSFWIFRGKARGDLHGYGH